MKIILSAKTIISICLVFAGFAVFAAFFIGDFFSERPKIVLSETERDVAQDKKDWDCVFNIEERIVRGGSLEPLIRPGDTVKILFGYYNCHQINRGDIVIFRHAGNQTPIIKIVKGIPGDKLELKESNSGWNILINDQVLKNSEGQPYLISGNRYKMLSLYEGVITDNAYLILGNLVSGSLDSTQFGLIDKSDILGRGKRK